MAAGGKNSIGVCWMLTSPDGRSDGRKLAYLLQPERHRHLDPELFDILAEAAAEPDQRCLQSIEDSGIIPGTRYFNAILSDRLIERQAFMADCQAEFADVDLVFFDPDNGIEVTLPKGRKNSSKYVYLDEIADFYATGMSVLIYQHFPRIQREAFTASCAARLRPVAHDADIWAFRTKHVVFLLLSNPASPPTLAHAVHEATSHWSPDFIHAQRIDA